MGGGAGVGFYSELSDLQVITDENFNVTNIDGADMDELQVSGYMEGEHIFEPEDMSQYFDKSIEINIDKETIKEDLLPFVKKYVLEDGNLYGKVFNQIEEKIKNYFGYNSSYKGEASNYSYGFEKDGNLFSLEENNKIFNTIEQKTEEVLGNFKVDSMELYFDELKIDTMFWAGYVRGKLEEGETLEFDSDNFIIVENSTGFNIVIEDEEYNIHEEEFISLNDIYEDTEDYKFSWTYYEKKGVENKYEEYFYPTIVFTMKQKFIDWYYTEFDAPYDDEEDDFEE